MDGTHTKLEVLAIGCMRTRLASLESQPPLTDPVDDGSCGRGLCFVGRSCENFRVEETKAVHSTQK